MTEPLRFPNCLRLLTGPDYNTDCVEKTSLPLLLCSLLAMETCLFAEPLFSNGCCTDAYFAGVD
jgi:hypothetical protein